MNYATVNKDLLQANNVTNDNNTCEEKTTIYVINIYIKNYTSANVSN